MTNLQLCEKLSLSQLTAGIGMDNEITGCYIGDLLSWVMGRAPGQCAWITVMGNVNAIAVAQLADISCIILCEGSALDDNAKAQAEIQGVPIFSSDLTAYQLALRISELLDAKLK